MIDVSTVEEIKMLVKEQTEEIKSLAEQSLDIVTAAHAADEMSEAWGDGSFAGADPDRSSADGTVIVFEDDSVLIYHPHRNAWSIGWVDED
jgi:hypothetical protein